MYCSIDDILNDFDKTTIVQLVNDENRVDDSIDLLNPADNCTMRILEQIKAADDEIDGYLRSRYNLPLTTTPARIKQISKDLSIYNIYKRRHRADMPDSLISLYKSTIGELEQIRKGYISLEITDTPGIVEAADILTNKKANDKIFSRDYLNSF